MTKPKSRKPQSKGSGKKTSEKTSAPILVPQPHGGALQVGNPGNSGGGRPRSIIRDDVLLSFDINTRKFLDDVVSGQLVSRIRFPLLAAVKHLTCVCGAKGAAIIDPKLPSDLEIEVQSSASIGQRLDVAELQARYGLGAVREVTVDNVRERVNRTLDVLQARLSPEQYMGVCREIGPIWA